MFFKTIRAQLRDYKIREIQDVSLFEAVKIEGEGASTLHDLALMQRRRAMLARKRTNWVFGALMATIFVGFVYYVGAPLLQQINDATRRAYTAELAIHQEALDDLDVNRDMAWGELRSYFEEASASTHGDENVAIRTGSTAYIINERNFTPGSESDLIESIQNAINEVAGISLEPGSTGDAQLKAILQASSERRVRDEALDEYSLEQMIGYLYRRGIWGDSEALGRANFFISQRPILTQKRDAALNSLNEIRAGGFSLVQRRQDFRLFMETCRDGVAENATRSKKVEKTETSEIENVDETVEETDVTEVCAQTYQAIVASEKPEPWSVFAERAPPALLLLFFLATLGPLYRYSLRLTGFHNARADFFEFMSLIGEPGNWPDEKEKLAALISIANVLAADKVEFGKSNTPTDQAIELAKSIRSQ